MATQTVESPEKLARAAELAKAESEAKTENEKRGTAKGLRVFAGMTRGKGTQVIKWEAFDREKPDTLPQNIAEFIQLAGIKDPDKEILDYALDGFNASQYREASDPIAEFVEPSWDKEKVMRFRLVVRNYAAGTGQSLDEAVALIKPQFVKA